MYQINSSAYLSAAFTTNKIERLKMFVYSDWLPDRIIDCHAHCNKAEHVGFLDSGIVSRPLSSFPDFDIKQSQQVKQFLYPCRQVRTLRFPNAYRGINHKGSNDYLLSESPSGDIVALYGIPDDVEYTISMMRHSRVSAIKMYHMYFNPPAEQVYDFFYPEILEEAQCLGLPIILHLPYEITQSYRDVLQISNDFPRLTIVLAHMGLAPVVSDDLENVYRHISLNENIFLDTSAISDDGVMRIAMKVLGVERIMFGTDEPLNLLRVKFYKHPQLGNRLMAEYPYHWVNPEEDGRNWCVDTETSLFHWQMLDAIAQAIDTLPLKARANAKELIFFENASRCFGF